MGCLTQIMSTCLAVLVLSASHGDGAVPCNEAVIDMMPCWPFLVGSPGGEEPGVSCCIGVDTLRKSAEKFATTPKDRRELCECIKNAATKLGVKSDRAKQLPELCHVQMPVPVDPKADCTMINGENGGKRHADTFL